MFDLTGKVALVTGASRGIGQETLLTLGRAGAAVVGTATTQSGADRITAALREAGLTGVGMVLNVNDAGSIEPLFAKIAEDFGPVAVLVNNAGITRDQLAMRMKDEEWDDVISTNLSAVFKMTKAAMRPMMKARHGRVINITSVVGVTGNPGQANYAAAKAGVAGMTKALARELGSRNITVNCVAPGFIKTDMTDALSEAQIDQLKQQIPLGRLGQVDDIAAAVLYLASDHAGYVTGTTLHVNGGMWIG
ncbi:MAG TPA: 3-oxoacyl-ACP reductase FabG [Limnobacter sp.]|uniref:3-oxoacyl-ACP reductase FabG n=1 Tax=Limnobacter sp. TaxID=2003368 RepID=UPI002E33AEAC|nr:3-oxoacyl-ACP reductase FabG [Limnobacter sp.]HEX5484767.1 3-oxoacyl-ACP reductase FabG [Limnobacter sp.]